MTMPHATITDAKALSEVPYDRLVAFLEREGFTPLCDLSEITPGRTMYSDANDIRVSVWRGADGMAIFVANALAKLTASLDRSQLDIYADIMGFRWARIVEGGGLPAAELQFDDEEPGE